MSLILDALKRSDRERRIAAGEPFATSVPRGRRMGSKPLLAVILILIVAVAAVWLWRGNGWSRLVSYLSQGEPASADSEVSQVGESGDTLPAAQSAPVLPATQASENQGSGANANPTTPALVPTASPSTQVTQPEPPAPQSEPERQVASPSAPGDSRRNPRRSRPEPEAPAEPAPLEIYELPMGIRLQIPQLTMNVHVYAGQPEDRFVLINMQRVEEGDELEGVIARAIRPDGILMEFQGHQFLLRRP